MWEFMSKYADSFWTTGEYAWEVFSVIIAWAVTLGFALGAIHVLTGIGKGLKKEIEIICRKRIRERKNEL